MKLSAAIDKGKNKHWLCANIRKNPASPTEWFVMLVDKNQLSHMLVDDNEIPVLSRDLNCFTDALKSIGVREFTVFL